ncbi:MAG: hypothetical protein P1V97_18325 [Planctomycetota bacterium]|nr:hypothetical protein [Planctomycetota bacterium]
MFKTIDDITYDRKEDEDLVRKQLEKEVLTKGAWATIVFKYQEIDQKTDDFGAEKAAIVRYRKRNGQYTQQRAFAITNAVQAKKIVKILSNWFPEDGE